MALLLALASAFLFALDTVFMARHYRALDPLVAVTLRGVALGMIGLPMLLLADPAAFATLPAYLPHLAFGGAMALLANWGYANATRLLPCGIANAGVMALQVGAMSIIGVVVFGEFLSTSGWIVVAVILATNVFLAVGRYTSVHALTHAPAAGLAYTAVNGFAQSGMFLVVVVIARDVDPFLAAYLVEVSITFWGLIVCAAQSAIRPERGVLPGIQNLPSIAWACAPAIPALACYALAVRSEQVALVQATFTSVALFAAVLGAIVFREHLRRPQAAGLLAVVLAIASFELV